jgi:hypothetical protein
VDVEAAVGPGVRCERRAVHAGDGAHAVRSHRVLEGADEVGEEIAELGGKKRQCRDEG